MRAPSAGRSLHSALIVCAALTLVSVLFDFIGADASDQWPAGLVVFDVAELVGAVALIGSRRVIWGGLIVGLLSWEWALVGLYENNTVADYLGSGHLPTVVGNLIGLVALGSGLIGLLRSSGYVEARRVWARAIGALILLVLTVPLSIECAYILAISYSASLDTANGWVYGIGFVAGLVLPLFAAVRPEWVATRFVAAGWLIGGFTAAIGTAGAESEGTNTVFTLVLLVVTAIVMLVTLWPWRTHARQMSASRSMRDERQRTL